MNATLVLLIVATICCPAANADGGTVRLREASGPFIVTIFTGLEPLRAGPIDTSVLVQDRETGRVLLDANVNIAFQPASGTSHRLLTRATHVQAGNKLLQAVLIDLPVPGWWTIQVFVRRNLEETMFATRVLVMPAASRLTAIWQFLALPPLAVVLFALHQMLRHSRRL
uniref:YtkA-like domain-containing protein n=1 Tax=Solibacter usitatus (strain Ellin6076) TaxID=234267 RepID=Q01PC4_SOLUE